MNHFCVGLGLVISTTKTEVVVFNGPGTASTWRVGAQVLPQSASFKYLGLIFRQSGTMSYALQRLAHDAVGACAQLRAKFRGLLCQKSDDEAFVPYLEFANRFIWFGGLGPLLLLNLTT